MDKLKRFANETKFSQVDSLMIARKMKSGIQLVNADFTHVMTEVWFDCTQIWRIILISLIVLDGHVSEFVKLFLSPKSIF